MSVGTTQNRRKAPFMENLLGLMGTYFGRETRYIAQMYLQRIFLLVFVVMTVVLSLDVASNIRSVLSDATPITQPEGMGRLFYYVCLRAGYDLPGILPLTMILGIIWTELELATSGERLMIFNSGRRIALSLMPALLVGLVMGLLQFGALAYVRPITVEQQALGGFRGYGPKFDKPRLSKEWWIVTENTFIKSRVDFGPPVALYNPVVYNLDATGTLVSIMTADMGTSIKNEEFWLFKNGSIWEVPSPQDDAAQAGSMQSHTFQDRVHELSLNPVWLENVGISPALLPQSTLAAIATAKQGTPEVTKYRSAYQERFASILHQIAVALLGAALCMRWFSTRMQPSNVLKVVGLGLFVYFGSSILSLMGSYGVISVFLATWSTPTFTLLAVAVLVSRTDVALYRSLSRRFFSRSARL